MAKTPSKVMMKKMESSKKEAKADKKQLASTVKKKVMKSVKKK